MIQVEEEEHCPNSFYSWTGYKKMGWKKIIFYGPKNYFIIKSKLKFKIGQQKTKTYSNPGTNRASKCMWLKPKAIVQTYI